MARPVGARASRHPVRADAGTARGGERGSAALTPRRAGWLAGGALLLVYLLTLAPGVTFWDAGEFVAAAHGFGIPHPPGTPLYVAAGRTWIVATSAFLSSARAMNLLSALCSAAAGAVGAWVMARERGTRDGATAAAVGAVLAGVMSSVWANATETEVYAVSLLHVALLLACASRCADASDDRRDAWLACTAYGIALAPALHLSALVGTPAVIVLASMRREGGWRPDHALLLSGVVIASAGVGRMSPLLVAIGLAVALTSAAASPLARRSRAARRAGIVAFVALPLAFSALVILLLRARHDPVMNQGDPATLGALAQVVARRQYDVAALWPRQAPIWLQLANVAQYVDWQAAVGWGRGIFTTPARVIATIAYVALGAVGMRALHREAPRLALTLATLLLCGTLGVAAYLNLKAGASLGYGLVPDGTPHEARERDYFFVLGFWAWGALAGAGAVALARQRSWPAWAAAAVLVVPLLGNWSAADRSAAPDADAAATFARALLESAPPDAVVFVAGDNDSYPLWHAQQVLGLRRDVLLVTVPLLPAGWYPAEIARRTGWRWAAVPVAGTRWEHEGTAVAIAAAARRAGRPIAVSPLLTARERRLLGAGWTLGRPIYLLDPATTGVHLDSAAAARWLAGRPPYSLARRAAVDDVVPDMLALLDCPRLAVPWTGPAAMRDSLEVTCNLR